jgi:hypothetical protein
LVNNYLISINSLLIIADDYDIANSHVDDARILSGGESQSGTSGEDSDKEHQVDNTKKDSNLPILPFAPNQGFFIF